MTYIDPARIELSSGESTLPRATLSSAAVASTNDTLRLTYLLAKKTETITAVRMTTGSTAAVGATLARIGVYEADSSGNLTLVGSCASDTALWIAANTAYSKTLSASFAKKRGIWYAVGTLVVGTSTAPTFVGVAGLSAAEAAIAPRVSGLVGSQSDLPSSVSVGSIGNSGQRQYAVLVP